MRKLIYIMAIALFTLNAEAQNVGLFAGSQTKSTKTADYTPYEQGTLPMQNGKVVFSKTIAASGKNKAQIYKLLASWASVRYMADSENGKWNEPTYFRNLAYASVREGNEESGHIICQGCEELVFSNKFLSKDYTEVEYTLEINIKDGAATATISNIVYKYTFTSEPERRRAEDVITDENAFTKKGKWINAYRKFRVKTMDFADELFREIEVTIGD